MNRWFRSKIRRVKIPVTEINGGPGELRQVKPLPSDVQNEWTSLIKGREGKINIKVDCTS